MPKFYQIALIFNHVTLGYGGGIGLTFVRRDLKRVIKRKIRIPCFECKPGKLIFFTFKSTWKSCETIEDIA